MADLILKKIIFQGLQFDNEFMQNYWIYSGEVIRIREHTSYDIGATLSLKGISLRIDAETTGIVEFAAVIPERLWLPIKKKIKLFSVIEVTGHFESWVRANEVTMTIKQKKCVDEIKIIKI